MYALLLQQAQQQSCHQAGEFLVFFAAIFHSKVIINKRQR
jgi:hypothetical protein